MVTGSSSGKSRGERTHLWAVSLMVVATLLNSSAQLIYKYAVDMVGLDVVGLLLNGVIILGLVCYGLSGVLLILALRGGQASVLYPVYTLSFIWIGLGAWLLFGEHITLLSVIGMVAIVAGIIMINGGSS